MSSSPVTGLSAELIGYAHGSTRTGGTCTPCVTPPGKGDRPTGRKIRQRSYRRVSICPRDRHLDARAAELLRELAGPDAAFREHQLEAVRDLVADRARVLCVQRTGLGQVRRLLHRHRAAARARRRADADRLAAAGADAQPDRGGRAARHPRAHDQLDQPRRVGRGARAARRRRGRPAADQPRAAEQPALPRGDAAAVRRARRAASSSTRRTASRDWGHDFRPDYRRSRDMLAAAARRASPCSARPRPPTTAWSADVEEQLGGGTPVKTYRGPLGRVEPALRGRRAARARPTGWPGWRRGCRSCRARGSSTRSPSATPSVVAEWLTAPRDPGRGLQRRGRDRAARRGRGPAAAQRAQGGRGDERARHGLRQARPRLRRALPGAGLGRRLLPAGRPRRPRRSSARRSCCCAAPRTAGSRTSSSSRRSRARERGRARCSSSSTRRATARRRRELMAAGQPRRGRHRGDAQGARRRGRGRPRGQPLGARAGGDWGYDAERYAQVTALRRARAGGDGRVRRRRALPDARAAGGARRPRPGGLRALRGLRRPALRRRRSIRRWCARRRCCCARGRWCSRSRRWRPDADGAMRKLPEDVRAEEGRALARLGDGGWDPAVQAGPARGPLRRRAGRRGGRARARVGDPSVAWVAAVPSRREGDPVSDFAQPPRRGGSACRSRTCSSARTTARRSARWPTPPSRSPTCAARSRSTGDAAARARACSSTTSASAAGRWR